MTRGGGLLRCELKNLRRQIGGQHVAVGTNPLGDVQGLVAGAGGHIEHMGAGFNAGHSEHGLRRLVQPRPNDGAGVAPAPGRLVPLRAHRRRGNIMVDGRFAVHGTLLRTICGVFRSDHSGLILPSRTMAFHLLNSVCRCAANCVLRAIDRRVSKRLPTDPALPATP